MIMFSMVSMSTMGLRDSLWPFLSFLYFALTQDSGSFLLILGGSLETGSLLAGECEVGSLLIGCTNCDFHGLGPVLWRLNVPSSPVTAKNG